MKPRIWILIVAFLVLQAGASQAGSRYSIFGGAGVAKPEGVDLTFFGTGGMRVEFKPNWAIEPSIGYWRADNVDRQCPSPNCAVYDFRDISVGANLLYIGAIRKVGLFIGGGVSAHFRDRFSNIPPGSNSNAPDLSATRLGFQFTSGADIPIKRRWRSVAITTGVTGSFVNRSSPLDSQYVFTWHGGLRYFFN